MPTATSTVTGATQAEAWLGTGTARRASSLQGAPRAERYAAAFAAGYHPVSKAQLAEDAPSSTDPDAEGRRCGTCRFRMPQSRRGRQFQKCLFPGDLGKDQLEERGYPYASRTSATDIQPDWPGCVHHSYGDTGLSPDAARHVPEGAAP